MYAIIKPGYPTALVDGVVVAMKSTPTSRAVPLELLEAMGFAVRFNAHEMQIEIRGGCDAST